MSIFGKLKLIDLYKKVPHDLTEGTYGGAICKHLFRCFFPYLKQSPLAKYQFRVR